MQIDHLQFAFCNLQLAIGFQMAFQSRSRTFLFLVTVKYIDSEPCRTQWVGWRETRAAPMVWEPVRRVSPRMRTMLGGRFGRALPLTATPAARVGTRTTRFIRRAEVCTFRAWKTCSMLCGVFSVGLFCSS